MDWLTAWTIALQQHPAEKFVSDSVPKSEKNAGWWLLNIITIVWILFGLAILSVEPRNELEREVVRRTACELRNNC